MSKAAAETTRTTVRAELVKLIRGVIDAQQAEAARAALRCPGPSAGQSPGATWAP